jgi:hypothetical protein
MVEIKKGSDIGINDEKDVSTTTAITAIRSTKWNKLFTVNRDTTISSAASRGIERYMIYK